MKLNVKVALVQTTMAGLKACQDIDEVSGYCKNCSNYKKNYTCPEFDFEVEDYLNAYKYVTLILTSVEKDSFKSDLMRMKEGNYKSQVLDNYKRDYPMSKITWEEAFSMYVFNEVKDRVTEKLIEIEKDFQPTLSSPPGSCTRCSMCRRISGEPCVFSKSIRYSLEALGFKVSTIYEKYFDKRLDWTESGLQSTFDTCSALFSAEELSVGVLEEALNSIYITI